MIGYLTPLEEGELLCSAIARTADLLFPKKSYRFIADILLGSEYATFGVLIPNNCSQLLSRVPAASGLDRASVLEASCYHVLSPFLPSRERAFLEKSIFEPQGAGMRGWFGRKPKRLKYCLLCAREDAEADRPQIWRVHPNHPAVTCCLRHNVRLTEIPEPVGSEDLLLPARWINLDAASPSIATFAERHVAGDIAWLLQQRSNFLPAFGSVAAELRTRLLSVPGFNRGTSRLQQSLVRASIRQHALEACSIVDPRLISNSQLSLCDSRAAVQRYSILALLAGSSLREVVTYCCTNKKQAHKFCYHITETQTERAKAELVAYIRENPTAPRTQILRKCRSADVVRRKALDFFLRVMPKPLPKGPRTKIDWTSRDEALEMKIKRCAPSLGIRAGSIVRIFEFVGFARRHHARVKSNLPRTWAAAYQVKNTWLAERKEAGLPILLRNVGHLLPDRAAE